MKFGIDFDGTIANTPLMKQKWIKENLNRDLPTWMNWKALKEELGQENHTKMNAFVHGENTSNTPPIPGAIEALKQLKELGELHLITARWTPTYPFVIAWLKKHGIHDWFSGFHNIVKKSEVCNELGISIFIDDELDYFSDVKSRKLLIKNGCTEKIETPEDVELVTDWQQVMQLVHSTHPGHR